jgi:hypothetical protein
MKRLTGLLVLLLALSVQGCAVVPTDHDVFLEFEPPQAARQPAAPAPAQAPSDTEIYLAPMKIANGAIEIGPAVDITNNPGYDNQPFFTPDGKGVLFTSVRGGPSTALPSTELRAGGAGGTQTDIYKYDIAANPSTGFRAGQISQVTEASCIPGSAGNRVDGSRDARTAQLGRGHAPCCQPERGLSGARRSSSAEPLIYCREGPR